ncbi:MAG: flagellar export chaperone FlgN [Deltaproteobacteria bacterium]|nr:flagellar export chaperone FlgN [Deltaproteobacteria bacterium]
MNSLEMQVEGSYEKQAAMLEQLRDCLEMERESLIQVDVEELWELMEKKNTLVVDIEKLGNEIKCLLNQHFKHSPENPRASALKEWPWFGKLSRQTALLKEDIQTRLKENLSFIQDTLGFFDELVGIIVKGGTQEQGYEHLRKPLEASGPRIYHREV